MDLAAGIEPSRFRKYIDDRFSGLHFAPIAFLSALEGQGLEELCGTVRGLWEQAQVRVPTAEINRILQRTEVREIFVANDLVPLGGTPDALGDYLKIEIVRWAKVIRDAGVKPE